jgi:hypothetical protein
MEKGNKGKERSETKNKTGEIDRSIDKEREETKNRKGERERKTD